MSSLQGIVGQDGSSQDHDLKASSFVLAMHSNKDLCAGRGNAKVRGDNTFEYFCLSKFPETKRANRLRHSW